jgi:hypothetical protein
LSNKAYPNLAQNVINIESPEKITSGELSVVKKIIKQ